MKSLQALSFSLLTLSACSPVLPNGEQDPTNGMGGASGTDGGPTNNAGGAGGTGGGPIEAFPTQAFVLGGQSGWEHDEAQPSGYFHTYDALSIGEPGFWPRKIHVYLPREYKSGDARYPVAFMNDGHTTFWPGGPGNITWDVDQALNKLYGEKAIPKVIIVAVHPIEREREYSHVDMGDGKPCCDLPKYTSYLADDLKGWVDTYYRTKPEAANTAVIGSSRGGLAAFYIANSRPDRFGKAACMSPSFWAGLDPVFGGNFPGGPLSSSPLIMSVKDILSNASLRPRLWIDWGLVRTGGFHNDTIEAAATARGLEMVSLLQTNYGYALGEELFWAEDPVGGHDELSWGRRFPDMMKALFSENTKGLP